MMVSNLNASTVGFDKLSAAYQSNPGHGSSALKGAMETQEMIQTNLSEMMRDVTPNLGQNIDMVA